MRTLRNAVEQDKVHHAYLFVGSRGTGKTSMAKILAALPELRQRARRSSPAASATPACRSPSATSLDVIEMDAASNNSVDDIRDLRERVAFAPVSGRHKVYILDEAHMLSPQAWNAFLKTLEEPPPHTIFVLATTEAHKVLPTVVDRCHRFDFARPTVEQLAAVVRRVADEEGIEIAARRGRAARPPRHRLLPRRARHARAARHLLGARDRAPRTCSPCSASPTPTCSSARSTRSPPRRRAPRCWPPPSLARDAGRDLDQFMRDLEAHARDLLVVQTLGEVPPELRHDARPRRAPGRAGRGAWPRPTSSACSTCSPPRWRRSKDGADARTQLELALVKAAPRSRPVDARAARADRAAEAALAGARPAPAPPRPLRAAPPPPPASRAAARVAGAAPAAGPAVRSRAAEPPPRRRAPVAAAEPRRAEPGRRASPGRAAARRGLDLDLAVAASGPRSSTRVERATRCSPRCSADAARRVSPATRHGRLPEPTRSSAARPRTRRTATAWPRRSARSPGAARASPTSSATSSIAAGGRGRRARARRREEELVARFKAEFDAEEIVPEPDQRRGGRA